MFKDKTGMFESFGMKLMVIDQLLDKDTSFSDELEELQEKCEDAVDDMDAFECIPEMVEFFENLVLTDEDLEQVTELIFDGGNDIYFLLMPDWDGESDEFDVTNIGGYKRLTNLKRVEYISMCDEDLMEEWAEEFRQNGIEVE
jgi:hypothetical protein